MGRGCGVSENSGVLVIGCRVTKKLSTIPLLTGKMRANVWLDLLTV